MKGPGRRQRATAGRLPDRGDSGQPVGIAYCSWHKGLSDTARLVQTGTAGKLFACDRCRTAHRLVPLADQP